MRDETCRSGKIAYPTKQAAHHATRRMRGSVEIYQCGFCKDYHVGQTPKALRQARRERRRPRPDDAVIL